MTRKRFKNERKPLTIKESFYLVVLFHVFVTILFFGLSYSNKKVHVWLNHSMPAKKQTPAQYSDALEKAVIMSRKFWLTDTKNCTKDI